MLLVYDKLTLIVIISRLRTLSCDWLDGVNKDGDDYKQKHATEKVHLFEDRNEARLSNAPKTVGPSLGQLQVMRMLVETLHDPDVSDSFISSVFTALEVDRFVALNFAFNCD